MQGLGRLAGVATLLILTGGCTSDTSETRNLTTADAGVIDMGAPDAGFGPCNTDQECPRGWKCLFWDGFCGDGRCEPACPAVYDAAFYLNCDCNTGTWRTQRCTDYRWSHQGAWEPGPDGGVRYLQAGEPCTPMWPDAGP